MNNIEFLNFISQTLIGFSFFLGVMLYYRHTIILRIKSEREKKKITLDLCITDTRVYESIINKNVTPYYKQLESNEQTTVIDEVNEALSYFEKISIGMTMKVYDVDTLRAYYEKYFLTFYGYYKYYILMYRENNNLPYLYYEFEKYARKWREEPRANNNLRRPH